MLETDLDRALKDQQELYDRSWHDGLEGGKEQRGNLAINLDFLERTNLLDGEQHILEVGCGIGSIAYALSQQGYHIIGTDISHEAIAYGRKKYPNVTLEVHPAEVLPYDDQSFDRILSFDLLEHIEQVDRHIEQVYRILKPGGVYLLQTPNKISNVVFETLSHRSFRWRRYHPSLHTPGQLCRRFKRHGFDLTFEKMNPINDYTRAKLKKIGIIGLLISRIPFESLPISIQTNLYAIAHKR